MSAISRALTGRGKKKDTGTPASPKPLIEPIPAAPALPQIEGVGVEETLRRAAGRKKAKTGRSGTLLSGPRGIEDSPTPQRKTLLGH